MAYVPGMNVVPNAGSPTTATALLANDFTTFTVASILALGSPITATGATISGAPGSGTVGTAITGVTDTLTPSGATGYASISVGGVEQTPRTAFTGTSVPSLTPASAGTATISIYAAASGGSALATSGSITVTAVTATAATIGTVSGTGTAGTAITGISDTLTPSGATAYVSITVGGVEQTPRTAFTGTTLPSLTPVSAGTATLKIFAAASGGTALATSTNITVSLPTATGASFSSMPTTGTASTALSGGSVTFTPAYSAGWVVLHDGTAEQGSRVSASTGALPTLTPAAAGTFTVKAFAASTGGTALATSGSITVAASGGASVASLVPAGGTVLFVLDTSNPTGHLYSDEAATTQATTGGTVRAIKDKNGGSLKFIAAAAGIGGYAGGSGALVANVLNSKPALRFAGGTAFAENAATIRNAITGGSYVTIFAIYTRTAGDTGVIWGSGNANSDENVFLENINGSVAESLSGAKAGTPYALGVGSSGSYGGNPALSISVIHAVASTGTIFIDSKPFVSGGTRGNASTVFPAMVTTWLNTLLGGNPRPASGVYKMTASDVFVFAVFTSPAAPTTAERNAMFTYASSDWGLT